MDDYIWLTVNFASLLSFNIEVDSNAVSQIWRLGVAFISVIDELEAVYVVNSHFSSMVSLTIFSQSLMWAQASARKPSRLTSKLSAGAGY